MNRMNFTLLIIYLRIAAKYAKACGMHETSDWLRSVAEFHEKRHPELFVE